MLTREEAIIGKYNLFTEDFVRNLKIKYKKEHKEEILTEGQIILNWHMSIGVVPIPGTSNPNRMKENLKEFEINQDFYDLWGSSGEDKMKRFNDGSSIFGINIFA